MKRAGEQAGIPGDALSITGVLRKSKTQAPGQDVLGTTQEYQEAPLELRQSMF